MQCRRHLSPSKPSPFFYTEIDEFSDVKSFLNKNPKWLQTYLNNNFDFPLLENSIITKNHGNESATAQKCNLYKFKKVVPVELTPLLLDKPSKLLVLRELSTNVVSCLDCDGFNLYLVDKSLLEVVYAQEIERRYETGDENFRWKIGAGSIPAAYVAYSRYPMMFSIGQPDSQFPEKIPFCPNGHHFLCCPLILPGGNLIAVLELYRTSNKDKFCKEDEQAMSDCLKWGSVAAYYADIVHVLSHQKKLNDFLLSIVRSIFQNMISMDSLIVKIIHYAQRLVNADRASLFLVDQKTQELYSRLFDVRIDDQEQDSSNWSNKEIRFSVGTGIAGYVAQTGKILNIPDAYKDPRFNSSVDQQTGYITRTILCMPILLHNSIIGVVQMINKKFGCFTAVDEESFATFSTYCALALHHTKLYDKIHRSEHKYKISLDILSYHASCSDQEFKALKFDENRIPQNIPGYDNYYLNTLVFDEDEKMRITLFMFQDLFDSSIFDTDSLIRFIITVKKNYRRVPYHNWIHGFSVAHAMYSLLKQNPDYFKLVERLALFVGTLCHDLDHRGKSNKFLLETSSPLAAIYSTSFLEHHHFNQTVTILQQEGHNIFAKLAAADYKQILGNMKHCILATDLALFFPYKEKLTNILKENNFSWDNQDHRLLAQALSMTACDLCASFKTWDVQENIAQVIFEEFYEQGDLEREAGKIPIPMMDRLQKKQQAACQVDFMTNICIPCYKLLSEIIPESKCLYEGCKRNLDIWEQRKEQETLGILDSDKELPICDSPSSTND